MGSISINVGFGLKKKKTKPKYVDLSIPLKINDNGKDILAIVDYESIKNGIKNIFEWKPGERILNPEFGNQLYEIIDEPINDGTKSAITSKITNMLNRWEPRIIIDSIEITQNEDNNEYFIKLKYSIPTIGGEIQEYSTSLKG